MRAVRFISFAVAGLLPLAAAQAWPTVRLQVPPAGRYAVEDLWRALVVSDSVYEGVWFEGRVFEAVRGQVFWAKTRPFRLARGARVYQYRDVVVEKTEAAPGYEAFATRTGRLPVGSYRFELVLEPFRVGDSFRFENRPLGPPRLISPRDGDTLRTPRPRFVWLPPAPVPAGRVTYELRLAPMLPGQSPAEALRANRLWFTRTGLTGTSLVYPSSARALEEREYAWEVLARAPGGATTGSAAARFAVGAGRPLLTREQAIAIIRQRVIRPDSTDEDLLAFLGREPLGPGDKVRQAFDTATTVIDAPTWFAWLNDDFTAEFGHPVRYVFVNAWTGAVAVEEREFWPVVNEQHLWQTREELAGDRFVFFARPERE